MDKIYKLLPWLNARQAVDWLSRLTDTQMTEELLISLCEAGHSQVFIDVGGACAGLDDRDWISNVIANGKHMVVDPSNLNKDPSTRSYMVLRGEVLDIDGGKTERRKDAEWFSTALPSNVVCFKQADILALADKINADEEAEKSELIAQADRHRVQRDQALNELHEAQQEIIRLQDKLEQTDGRSTDTELNPASRKSHLLAIGGLLRLIKDSDRPRYNQVGAVTAIASMNWTGAGTSSLNHIFAEANAAAKDADSELAAKLESMDLAVKHSAGA